MATRKKKGGGMAPAGMSKGLFTAVWLIAIAGGILGWARSNDIHSPSDAYDYAKAWSDRADQKVHECVNDKAEIKCSPDGGAGGGTKPGGGGADQPTSAEVSKLQATLKAIPSAPSNEDVAYDRADWQHWSVMAGQKCDSREETLLRQGQNVKTDPSDPCDIVSGLWIDPYSGTKIDNSTYVDIDHVIPLGFAAKNGGQEWPAAKKEAFANDLTQLIASSRTENRGKGDKGPADYMPPVKSYQCDYAQIWVRTASKYQLSLPTADKAVLEKALQTC